MIACRFWLVGRRVLDEISYGDLVKEEKRGAFYTCFELIVSRNNRVRCLNLAKVSAELSLFVNPPGKIGSQFLRI